MNSLDRTVLIISRFFGWIFILTGLFVLSLPLVITPFTPDQIVPCLLFTILFVAVGFPFSGLPEEIRRVWRRRTVRRFSRALEKTLGGSVETGPEGISIRWTGERQGKKVALFWILDGPSTQVSIQVPGGSPGTFRILPTWTRGGRLMGGRTHPIGHEEFDRHFIGRSVPGLLLRELFGGDRRDRVAGWILGLPGGPTGRVMLTLSDLRIRIPRILRRSAALETLLQAADALVEAILETARVAGFAVVSVGLGTEARCPICISLLESEVVLCIKCRTPHHEGCWQYTGECAIFACGGRQWIRSPGSPS